MPRVARGGPIGQCEASSAIASLRNFFHRYLPLADHATLYDSTLQPPRLVAEWHQSEISVRIPALHEQILRRLGKTSPE